MIDIKVGNIYCFKLNSGEEVVSNVSEVEDTHVGLNKPLSVAMSQQGPQMIPSLITGNPSETMWLNLSICSLIGEVGSDILEVYTKGTSELDLPPDKKIIME
jgi:hypothetical protein